MSQLLLTCKPSHMAGATERSNGTAYEHPQARQPLVRLLPRQWSSDLAQLRDTRRGRAVLGTVEGEGQAGRFPTAHEDPLCRPRGRVAPRLRERKRPRAHV